MQSRLNPGPATLRHHNAVIGCLRAGGFSVVLTAHAFALIDSYLHGFVLSETALPIHGPDSVPEVAESMMQQYFSPDDYPYLLEFTMEHVVKPDYDFGAEFEFGLDPDPRWAGRSTRLRRGLISGHRGVRRRLRSRRRGVDRTTTDRYRPPSGRKRCSRTVQWAATAYPLFSEDPLGEGQGRVVEQHQCCLLEPGVGGA